MKLETAPALLLLCLAASEGCASTSPQNAVTTAPRRRQRAARPAATSQPEVASMATSVPSGLALVPASSRASDRRVDGGAMDARTAPRSIGTPAIRGGNDVGELHPEWTPLDGRARVRCGGTQPSLVPSTQSPYEPGSAAIVRSFQPVERRVIACRPPTDARGRLPAHGLFNSNGAPTEYTFPGVSLTREQATCVGEALCAVRVPAFRAPSATIDYEVLVYVTAGQ